MKPRLSLHPFQQEGVRDLVAHTRRYLADEMGLGKTVQCAVASELIPEVRQVRVVCPAMATGVWKRIWPQWSSKEVDIVSYDKARTAGPDRIAGCDLLICDEAHYLKSRESKRSLAVLTAAQKVPRVWFVSGTPMPNMDPREMYPILRAIWPDLLRPRAHTYWTFTEYFTKTVSTQYNLKLVGLRHTEEWRELLRTVMLRRTWEDARLQLPPLQWEDVPLPIESKDRTNYLRALAQQVSEEALTRIEDALAYGQTPPLMGEISTIRRLHGTLKAPAAGEVLAEELRTNAYDKVVVMAHHRDVLAQMRAILEPFGLVELSGEVPPAQARAAERLFQEDASKRVFLGQLQSAGVALTLTAGHEIVLVEQDWVPENNRQAVKRIHRIGQENPCRARCFIAEGTIDEAVSAVRRSKLSREGEIYP